jgi:hypothetical protein
MTARPGRCRLAPGALQNWRSGYAAGVAATEAAADRWHATADRLNTITAGPGPQNIRRGPR